MKKKQLNSKFSLKAFKRDKSMQLKSLIGVALIVIMSVCSYFVIQNYRLNTYYNERFAGSVGLLAFSGVNEKTVDAFLGGIRQTEREMLTRGYKPEQVHSMKISVFNRLIPCQ